MNAYGYFTTSSLLFHIIAALSFLWRTPSLSLAGILPTTLAAASLTAGCIHTLYHFSALPSWLMLLATVISWLTVLGYSCFHMKAAMFITSPLCILLVCSDIIHRTPQSEVSFLRDLHILTAILGQAMAITACIASVLLLWKQKTLKQKPINPTPSPTPSLQKLTQILYVSLYIGVVFFSLALLSGVSYLATLSFSQITLELHSKVLWALAVWGFYLYLLFLKEVRGTTPTYLAKLSALGGTVLGAIFLIINAT